MPATQTKRPIKPAANRPPLQPADAYRILTIGQGLELVMIQYMLTWDNTVEYTSSATGENRTLRQSEEWRVVVVTEKKFANLKDGSSCGDATHPDLRTACILALELVGRQCSALG